MEIYRISDILSVLKITHIGLVLREHSKVSTIKQYVIVHIIYKHTTISNTHRARRQGWSKME